MASYFWLCTNCGSYVKGKPALVSEICETHMCDADINLNNEFQTNLNKLLAAISSKDGRCNGK